MTSKKYYAFVFSICFLSWFFSQAQEPILEGYIPIDSLKDKDYKIFIDHLNRTTPIFQNQPDSLFAHNVGLTYLWVAQQRNDSLNMGKAYCALGLLENYRVDFFDKAIAYTENHQDKFQPALSYISKSDGFFYQGKYKKSIKLLFKAKYYAEKNRNDQLLYAIERNINSLRSDWGNKKYALEEYKKVLSFINSEKYNLLYPDVLHLKQVDYIDTQYSLAQTYFEIKEYKKASVYLDSVYQYGVNNNLDEYEISYLGLKGGILYREGNYQEALKHTNQFLKLEDPDDLYAISRSSVVKGLTLWELNYQGEAIQVIEKADSLYQITDDEFEELGEGYQLLINHYKEIDDTENQLIYLNKLLEFDRKISSNYIEIGNRIEQEYTVPQLLAEKEVVISKLNAEKTLEKRNKYIVFILLGILGVVIIYYIRAHYQSKKRFRVLQRQFEQQQLSTIEVEEIAVSKKSISLELDETQIDLISKGVEAFEQSHEYLNTGIALKSVAQSMNTNSSYLSKYINQVKGSNFSQYISDLRIQYAIQMLQKDTKFRSYTIEAIASEVGFSNTRSFTNHFKRVTGITVSYFIKKLSPSS